MVLDKLPMLLTIMCQITSILSQNLQMGGWGVTWDVI